MIGQWRNILVVGLVVGSALGIEGRAASGTPVRKKQLKHSLAPTAIHIEGILRGALIGDILGRASESATHTYLLKKLFGAQETVSLRAIKPQKELADGEARIIYTEDVTMMLVVLESCMLGRKYKWSNEKIIEAMVRGFVYWASSKHDPFFLYRSPETSITERITDRLSAQLVEHTLTDADWWKVPSNLSMYSNSGVSGSVVVRTWPIAIVFYDDLERVQQLAVAQAAITDQGPLVAGCCVAMATAFFYALEKMEPTAIVQQMIQAVKPFDDKIQLSNEKIKAFDFSEARNNPALVFAGARKAIKWDQLTIADMLRYVAKIHETAPDHKPSWSMQDIILGESLLGSNAGVGQGAGRTRTGGLLGFAPDELVAATMYLFLLYAHKDMQPSSNAAVSISWRGLQAATWTVGDSNALALLTGGLFVAFEGGLVLPAEEEQLAAHIENYERVGSLADYLAMLLRSSRAHKGEVPLLTPLTVYAPILEEITAKTLKASTKASVPKISV